MRKTLSVIIASALLSLGLFVATPAAQSQAVSCPKMSGYKLMNSQTVWKGNKQLKGAIGCLYRKGTSTYGYRVRIILPKTKTVTVKLRWFNKANQNKAVKQKTYVKKFRDYTWGPYAVKADRADPYTAVELSYSTSDGYVGCLMMRANGRL